MLTTPLLLGTRASAGVSATSAASVADVWDVLAHPRRWAEFDPFVRSVDGVSAEIASGQQFRAHLRVFQARVPIEVNHVVNRTSVAVTVRLLPGLAEEVEYLVIPSASGGTLLRVRLTLHGPLAVPALLPCWMVRALTVRLLARTAEAGLRDGTREVPTFA